MRKTDLKFQPEPTPGPYSPTINFKGDPLVFSNNQCFTFSKTQRFGRPSTTDRLGPGSYRAAQSSFKHKKKKDSQDKQLKSLTKLRKFGYVYVGKHLIYEGPKTPKEPAFLYQSTTDSNKK